KHGRADVRRRVEHPRQRLEEDLLERLLVETTRDARPTSALEILKDRRRKALLRKIMGVGYGMNLVGFAHNSSTLLGLVSRARVRVWSCRVDLACIPRTGREPLSSLCGHLSRTTPLTSAARGWIVLPGRSSLERVNGRATDSQTADVGPSSCQHV